MIASLAWDQASFEADPTEQDSILASGEYTLQVRSQDRLRLFGGSPTRLTICPAPNCVHRRLYCGSCSRPLCEATAGHEGHGAPDLLNRRSETIGRIA